MKTLLLLRNDVARDARWSERLDSVLRAFDRDSEAGGFRDRFASAQQNVEVRSKAGIILGRADVTVVEEDRLARFLERVVRALFYLRFREPVPANWLVKAVPKFEGMSHRWDRTRAVLSGTVPETLGDGVFSFRFAERPDVPRAGLWLLMFYDIVPFIVFVRPQDAPL